MKIIYPNNTPIANILKRGWTWSIFGFLLLAGCGGESLEVTAPKIEQKSPLDASNLIPKKGEYFLWQHTSVENECPKLVQKRVDHTAVFRQDSIMGDVCDYFIYPTVGDTLTASVSDGRMKPFLNAPYYHDFSNGGYKVTTKGRHVIRLEYNAFGYKPEVIDYVFVVNIESPK